MPRRHARPCDLWFRGFAANPVLWLAYPALFAYAAYLDLRAP